jgi:hypothetical protein
LPCKAKLVPPDFSAFVEAHGFLSSLGGLPPFLPFFRAISRMRSMPSRSNRAR